MQQPLLKEAAHKATTAADNGATKKASNEAIATKKAAVPLLQEATHSAAIAAGNAATKKACNVIIGTKKTTLPLLPINPVANLPLLPW